MIRDKDYGLVSSKAELNMLRRLDSEIAKRKRKCPTKKHTECEAEYNKE